MEQIQASDIVDLHQRSNDLIRKLRWIGMEDEAHRLEQAVAACLPKQEVRWRLGHTAPTNAHRKQMLKDRIARVRRVTVVMFDSVLRE